MSCVIKMTSVLCWYLCFCCSVSLWLCIYVQRRVWSSQSNCTVKCHGTAGWMINLLLTIVVRFVVRMLLVYSSRVLQTLCRVWPHLSKWLTSLLDHHGAWSRCFIWGATWAPPPPGSPLIAVVRGKLNVRKKCFQFFHIHYYSLYWYW